MVQLFFIIYACSDLLFSVIMQLNKEYIHWFLGLLHHLPAIYFSYNVILDQNFWNDKENHVTHLSSTMISYTTAYFMYDVVLQITRETLQEHWQFYLHAIMSCCTYTYIYVENKYHFYGAAFLTWETSSPFLYAAFYLAKVKKTKTILFKLNAFMLLTTFFVFRICFGNYMMFVEVWPHINSFLRLGALAFTGLNHYWFSKLLHKSISYVTET